MSFESHDLGQTFQKTLIVVGVIIGIAVFWLAREVFLLVFAGLLLGVLLDGLSGLVSKFSHLSRGWSLFITIFTLAFLTVAVTNLLLPGIIEQMKSLEVELPASIERLRAYLRQYSWGSEVLEYFPSFRELAGESNALLRQLTGAVSATVFIVLRMVLVLVIGIYSAVEPKLYRSGFLRLFAPRHHERIERVLAAIHDRMWWWLVSIAGSMSSLAILTFIGLRILDLPLALSLALLTGLLTFIPNFGSIISAVPPVLIGLMESPGKALAVIGMYVVIQFLEAHLVTPLIQRRTIRMPPVLGIGAQLTFGIIFGFLGLLLAAPLMAGILAVVQSISNERVVMETAPQANAT